MRTFSTIRAALVLIGIGLAYAALLGRIAYLQTTGRQQTIERADRQQYQTERLIARRGSIYDATGSLMAGTVQTRTLFVDPHFMQREFQREGRSLVQMDDAVGKLARLIEQDPFKLSQMLGERAEARFIRVADNLDEDTCKAISEMNIPGVGLLAVNQRYYPMGSLGAHVLGGVGRDGSGLEAMELKFEKLLAGHDGYKRTLKDARRRGISVVADDYLPPQHGSHVILTIDASIQMIAEEELAKTCREFNAKRGEIVVIDPRTGEIVALANYPTFNPQNLEDSATEIRRNNCLVSPFEPGSAIKPFIAGPAIAWNITRPSEVWPISGISWITPYGRRISDVHGYGPLAMWDVLVKSSNVGMAMLGERMGNTNLHRALTGFKLGRTTGIELPGEDPGLIYPLSRWGRKSTSSVVQGYELMVTPLQLARAFSAYGNGGRLVQPHVVKGVLDADGNLVELKQHKPLRELPQAIDPVAALTMRRILADVPVRGTAQGAGQLCPTWNIFGKTGTAHISEGKAGYSTTRYNSTFIGGAPFENPRLVVAVVIHDVEKKGKNYYGGTVSAPVAGRLFSRALAYLQMPESPELMPPPPNVTNVLVRYNPKVYRKKTSANDRVSLTTASIRD